MVLTNDSPAFSYVNGDCGYVADYTEDMDATAAYPEEQLPVDADGAIIQSANFTVKLLGQGCQLAYIS